MSLSIYETSVPVLIRALGVLSDLLDKGEAHARAQDLDPAELTQARLAPDMLPLARQIHIATDGAKGAGARLAGVEIPSYPDTETTFPELRARIARTIDFLKDLDPAAFTGAEDRQVELKVGGSTIPFSGRDFLLTFALPNFFFHIVTAYDILRHKGVAIGKRDYLGPYPAVG